AQPVLKNAGRRAEGDAMLWVVLHGTTEHDRDLTLRLDAFLYSLFNHTLRRAHADIFPGFLPANRRQRGEIAFDERLDRIQVEVAHEKEGEVARIRKSVLIERERFLQAPLIDGLRRGHTTSQMPLIDGVGQRFRERI